MKGNEEGAGSRMIGGKKWEGVIGAAHIARENN